MDHLPQESAFPGVGLVSQIEIHLSWEEIFKPGPVSTYQLDYKPPYFFLPFFLSFFLFLFFFFVMGIAKLQIGSASPYRIAQPK